MLMQKYWAEKYIDGEDVTPILPKEVGTILTRWINWEYANLPTQLVVELTENPESYKSTSELKLDIKENHLFVFSLYCEHPLFSVETNQKFRAVYDVRHHYDSDFSDSSSSLESEFVAYEKARQDLFNYLINHETVAIMDYYPVLDNILFSEIVLQASVYFYTGKFSDTQKIVF